MNAAGLVLAAGEGRRMGGPKARLLVEGKPLALWHVERMREAGLAPVLVVARPADMDWLAGLGVAAVASFAPDMGGSLAVGLTALAGLGRPLVVAPVDGRPAPVSTLLALAAAVRPPVLAAVACRDGRRSHPVALAPGTRLPPDLRLDAFLRELGGRCVEVEVGSGVQADDLDLPDDLLPLTGRAPTFS